jgi:hypothetical protein
VVSKCADIGRFKTSVYGALVRRVFSNGQSATLMDVVNFYNDPPGRADAEEKEDLVAFLGDTARSRRLSPGVSGRTVGQPERGCLFLRCFSFRFFGTKEAVPNRHSEPSTPPLALSPDKGGDRLGLRSPLIAARGPGHAVLVFEHRDALDLHH